MDKFQRYKYAVKFLEGLSNIPLKNDFMKYRGDPRIYIDRMNYFLDKLDNPQNNFKYIHVAGTSGKGSTSIKIQSILSAEGIKTGLFTSPYTTTSIEKIRVGELYIDPFEFADIVEEIKPIINDTYQFSPFRTVSYFEIFFAIALIYFKRQHCEWVVLETGVGGRYDATNIIEEPEICIINRVGYDHMDLLGDTLEEIATDQSFIIKEGCKFLTAESDKGLRKIMEKRCDSVGAGFEYVESNSPNETIAKRVGELLKVSNEAIGSGLKAKLPCRLEIIQEEPRVMIDGAHNEQKIRYLIEKLEKIEFDKLHLIIGMKDSKKLSSILDPFLDKVDHLYATRYQTIGYFPGFNCKSPLKIMKHSEKSHKNIIKEFHIDPFDALDSALEKAGKDDLVLITGSLYLCGELREYWISEEYVLENRRSFK